MFGGVNNINPTLNVGTFKNSKQLGKDTFLRLLVTQMKNQDPLNPMDNTQFVSQMAQFSALEQTTNLANSFDKFENGFSSSMQLQAASLIGKKASANSNDVDVIGGKSGTISFSLPKESIVYVKIRDANGKVVDAEKLGWLEPGSHAYEWSATNSDGVKVPDGTYTFQVDAIEKDGTHIQVSGTKSGTISSVKFEDGQIYVTINGVDYLLSQITQLS
ncbi:flagellar hook assembly protein FlgD [Mesoaciditoga lauensis]|uniref:flagellar hook assembly protein FlgD n=1 Tax=Mesoaciditoga lauensis TaxID=1495039 RepID=UPI00056D78CC|nr:flagellar hook capping FlgD N-terminal domain-containing protein [Mesoaciditoga lauensis]